MWGRPASPRPAYLGVPPRGRRLSDNGSDPLLESVDSWLRTVVAVARPGGLGEAGQPPSGPSRPLTWPRPCSTLGHSPGKWVLAILVLLRCFVDLWMDVEAFRSLFVNLDETKLDWLGFVLMITLEKFRGLVC